MRRPYRATRGLVHHYFGTKRELYLAVVADLAAELPGVVRSDVRDLPVDEMIDANVTSWLDSIGDQRISRRGFPLPLRVRVPRPDFRRRRDPRRLSVSCRRPA